MRTKVWNTFLFMIGEYCRSYKYVVFKVFLP